MAVRFDRVRWGCLRVCRFLFPEPNVFFLAILITEFFLVILPRSATGDKEYTKERQQATSDELEGLLGAASLEVPI